MGVGLAFFYLRATMSNPLFEFFAAVLALLLALATLLLIAATDWMAAYICEQHRLHRGMFLLLAGGFAAAAGLALVLDRSDVMRLLLLLVTLHAFVFGCWSLFFARRVWKAETHQVGNILLGLVSLGFAGAFFWTRSTDGRRAVTLLGFYTCFAGCKLIYHALRIRSASQRNRAQPIFLH